MSSLRVAASSPPGTTPLYTSRNSPALAASSMSDLYRSSRSHVGQMSRPVHNSNAGQNAASGWPWHAAAAIAPQTWCSQMLHHSNASPLKTQACVPARFAMQRIRSFLHESRARDVSLRGSSEAAQIICSFAVDPESCGLSETIASKRWPGQPCT